MSKKLNIHDEVTDFLLYTAPGGGVKVEVILRDETIWLTQQRIADLFGVQRPAITKHLKNIYESGELNEKSTSSILEHMGETGQTCPTKYYNLDAVISVGYRVNSGKATQFRIWATQLIKEYIIKGFAMDDERLKNGCYFGKDYFHELPGQWKKLHNPKFKLVEFDRFKNEAGYNHFVLSPKRWIDATAAIGLQPQSGRYGGTYTHIDIALEFAFWISVEFKLYLLKEFQRLKEQEALSLDWNTRRSLTKINYRIHTDAIKENIIPQMPG